MGEFSITLVHGETKMADQPSIGLVIENLDEAFEVAEADLEAMAIRHSLVTSWSHFYARIDDVKNPSRIPAAILKYKPSFQYIKISDNRSITDFLKGW